MSRKRIIVSGAFLLIMALIAFSLYFLAIFRVESSLQSLVKSQSEGKLQFKVKKVRFDVFHLRFDFQKPELRTIDSSHTINVYHVKAGRISIRVKSFISVFSGESIVIDSVIIQSPIIEVIKYQEGSERKISLPEEMSKVYESLEKVLKVINLNYLHINDAKFSVYDRSSPDERPLQVSNINLTINNFSEEQGVVNKNFLFADRIQLEIVNEDIVFPDGNHGIRFKRFLLGTRSQTLKLDSCYIYGRSDDTATGEFSIYIDSLRISKLDFNLLAKENILKFDSALCINPDIRFWLQLKEKRKQTDSSVKGEIDRESVDLKLKKLLGNLDIGYITVRNANVNVSTERNNKINIFKSQNSTFSMGGLVVNANALIPVKIDKVELDVHDYTGYSPDSLYIIKFDKVLVRHQKILLSNFRIHPSKSNPDPYRKVVTMESFELDEIDWLSLLYDNRIVAGHATLIRPEVRMELPEAEGQTAKKENINPFKILGKIQDKVQIGELYIEDGTMKFDVQKGPKFSMDHCYARINVNQLLASEDEFRLIDALDTLAFSKGDFHNAQSHFLLSTGKYSKKSGSLQFGRITQGKTAGSKTVTFNNVRLSGIVINSLSELSISEAYWSNATIDLQIDSINEPDSRSAKPSTDFKIAIAKLNGGPTSIKFKSKEIEATTKLNQISTGEIVIESGQNPKIRGFLIAGQYINFSGKNSIQGSVGDFYIQDNKTSGFSNVLVEIPVYGEIAVIRIPQLTFSTDIYKSINGVITSDFIEFNKPEISFNAIEAKTITELSGKDSSIFPSLNINRITIHQPGLINLPARLSDKMDFNPGTSTWNFYGIRSGSKNINIDSIHLSLFQSRFRNDKFHLSPSGKGKIDLWGSAFVLKPADQQSKSTWSFYLNALNLSGLSLKAVHEDTVVQTVTLNSLNFENLRINDSSLANRTEFVRYNNNFRISNGSFKVENGKTSLEIFNLSLARATNMMGMDSVAFYPLANRHDFMKSQDFQRDYIQLYSGKINAKGIDFSLLLADTVVNARKVLLDNVCFLVYKDKRLPYMQGIEKPLLTDLIKNLNTKTRIDTITLRNSKIEYEELNDKTLQYGNVTFHKIKGGITGIRNYNLTPVDSLKFNIYARFMDTVDLRVSYMQSYADSLSGFHLKTIVNSFELTAVNPLLKSFASAEVKSGYLDTIRFSAIGRKYISYGSMKMYYHDLDVQYLDKDSDGNQSMKAKAINFFAKSIVKKRKFHGSGDMHTERDPEKGFVNYWVKIFLSGVFTNTGVRTNQKQERKYFRSLRKYDVPPIPDIPADY